MPRFITAKTRYYYNGLTINKLEKEQIIDSSFLIFDSRVEAECYLTLLELEKYNKIKDLTRQVKFLLVSSTKWYNNIKNKTETIREINYVADFTFIRNKTLFVVDCKGWKYVKNKKTGKGKWQVYYDDIYKLKKKMFLNKYPDLIFQEM